MGAPQGTTSGAQRIRVFASAVAPRRPAVTAGRLRRRRQYQPACTAQAMPRLLGACVDAADTKLPAFDSSRYDIQRVRKDVRECLVDMSQAIVILVDSSMDEGSLPLVSDR